MKNRYNKYNNKKIIRNNEKFDSRKEYTVWLKLKRLEEMGEIRELQRQVPFILIPTQYGFDETGKKRVVERECKYIADFTYVDAKTNQLVVVDSKGVETDVFKIKKKLLLWLYNINIKIIK